MKPQKKDYVLLVVSLLTFASSAASFDCRQALLPDEKTICAIPQLSELDVELYVKYHFVKGLTFMGAGVNWKIPNINGSRADTNVEQTSNV